MYSLASAIVTVLIYVIVFSLFTWCFFIVDAERYAWRITLDFVVKEHWLFYTIMTIFYFGAFIWHQFHTDGWWKALAERYGEKFPHNPDMMCLRANSVLVVDNTYTPLDLYLTADGMLLRQKGNPDIFLWWKYIKNISISIPGETPRHADIEVALPEKLSDKLALEWKDEFTSWIPNDVSVSKLGVE